MSLMLLGAMIASAVGGHIVDFFGRRNAIIINSVCSCPSPTPPPLFFQCIYLPFLLFLAVLSSSLWSNQSILPPPPPPLPLSTNSSSSSQVHS